MNEQKDQLVTATEGLSRELWWRTAVAGSLSFVIPFGLFLILAHSASERRVRGEISAQLEQAARAEAQFLEDRLQARAESLKTLAQGLAAGAADKTRAWAPMLENFVQRNAVFARVAIVDDTGRIIAASHGNDTIVFPSEAIERARRGQTVFLGVSAPLPDGSQAFNIATPMPSAPTKAGRVLIASVIPRVMVTHLPDLLSGHRTESMLVSESGNIIATLQGNPASAVGRPFAPGSQQAAFTGEAGRGEFRDFLGEDVLCGYHKLSSFNSYVVTALPRAAITGEVVELRKMILFYVAPFLALGIVLAGIAWYYAMNRIQRLSGELLGALVVARQRENERDLALQELGRRFDEERELSKQRSQFEARLADYEKYSALAQLALGAAHEINNPLLGILSHLELELKGTASDDSREEIKQCIAGAKRISAAVRGLLNYSRPGPLNLTHVNLGALVNETMTFLQYHPQFRGIKIHTDIPADLPSLTADANQLSQILMNLLINAAEAMPEGGEITIAAEKLKFSDKVNITIKDTGCGIPADILPQIFQPFFTTKRGRGTGLGLSISQAYIRDHGGEINVESIPRRGTTVHISLPTRQEGRLVSETQEVIV